MLIYIGGEWRASAGSGRIPVVNPATEDIVGYVPDGVPADVELAVQAARAAFPAWSQAPVEDRARYLKALRHGLAARRGLFAETITTEMGSPIAMSERVQTGLPLRILGVFLDELPAVMRPAQVAHSVVAAEAAGVVAAITPWNLPLSQAIAKVAAAIAVGCTVVLKPSELAPLSAALLAEVVHDIDLPPGVFNLVSGRGGVVGEALVSHPEVDMVSFTGSTDTGRRVAVLAAATIKKVALELGGKSANVLLPDADVERAVSAGVASALLNSGQTCTALSRMLVPRSRYEEMLELAAAKAGEYRIGDPTCRDTQLGPLVSATARSRVLRLVESGVAAGARRVPSPGAQELPERGYFVSPVVLGVADADAPVAQEEIFGPVLCVIAYDDEDHALAIANNSRYGLAGGVWSADQDRAMRFAALMRTGRVDINGAPLNPAAPFGGYRQSGLGREMGHHGLREFQVLKAIALPSMDGPDTVARSASAPVRAITGGRPA